MKEYTFFALASVPVIIFIDNALKTGVLRKPLFWVFISVIFCFKLMVNGYLTFQNIVIYDSRYFMGLRFGSIPLEDFLFGFSMVGLTIISWEYLKKGRA